MQLHTLAPRTKNTTFTVVGRGGKRGKTSGRGGKGQTARAGHKIRPEVRDLIKKIPKRRGYGKNRSRHIRGTRLTYAPVNLTALEAKFPAGADITPATLFAARLVRRVGGRMPKVKILGTGEVSKAFTFSRVVLSASAKAAVEKAGGTINA